MAATSETTAPATAATTTTATSDAATRAHDDAAPHATTTATATTATPPLTPNGNSVQPPASDGGNGAPAAAPSAVLPGKTPQIASIYVGDLDATIMEPQLVELFRPFGTILNVRVCRDIITQRSLGYGYVNFDNHDAAARAIDTLNFTRVGDKCVRLMWQQRDPALRYSGNGNIFVKNLEQKVDSKALHDIFTKFGAILSCKIMEDEQGKSRGYGFVHFKDEQAAQQAIAQMNGAPVHANAEKQALYVASFIRRNARLAALVANFTNVYIKQVLPTVDKAAIEAFFAKFGGITSAAACRDKNGRVFAFCNFAKHDDAVKAIEAVHDHVIDGITAPDEKIYVQRAQPRSERLIALRQKYMQSQSLGNNLYVRNFDPSFTDDDLRELFKEYGEIKSCRVMTDTKGVSRGFGFVSFAHAEEANAALREMNGRMLNGKPLIVNIAQRRDQRYTMLRMQFQQRLHLMMRQLQMQQQQLRQQQQQQQRVPFMPAGGLGGMPPVLPGNMMPMTPQPPQQPQPSSAMPPHAIVTSSSSSSRPLRGRGGRAHGAGRGGSSSSSGGGASAAAHQQQQQPPIAMPSPPPLPAMLQSSSTTGAAPSSQPATSAPPPTAATAATMPSSSSSSSATATQPVATTPVTRPVQPTPRQSPGQAPDTPPLPPISLRELDGMSHDEQRAALGDRLFIKVCEVVPEYAPKITGMFLEMDYKDAYELLGNTKLLMDRITEAMCVLKAHERAQ